MRPKSILFSVIFLMAFASSFVSLAHAARLWLGNSSTDMGDAANWSGGLPTTTNSANSDVEFGAAGTSGTTLFIGTGTGAYRNWTFDAGAPSYSITNSANTTFFNFRSGATTTVNNSSSSQSFTAPAFLIQRGNLNAAAGDFQLNGPLAVENNNNTVTGPHDIYLNQGFLDEGSANNFQLTKTNSGTLFVNDSADLGTGRWAGQLAISDGTVQLNANNSLGAVGDPVALTGWTEVRSAWQIAGATDNAKLALNGVSTGETIFLAGRGTGTSANPHVVSLNGSGANTLSGILPTELTTTDSTIALQAGGTTSGDKLTVSGDLQQINSNVTGTLSLQGAGTGVISGTISQPASTAIFGLGPLTNNVWNVVKNDAGTWTIASNQAYTGTTTVAGGTLLVNALHAGGAGYTVNGGATLGGTGTIDVGANAVNIAGILSAGDSLSLISTIGLLHVTASSVTIPGTWNTEYSGLSNSIDRVDVTGALDLTGSTLNFINLGGTLGNQVYVLGSYTSLSGMPSVVNGVPANFNLVYNYAGNEIALVPTPEPSAFVLGALGVTIGFGARRWRRRAG